MLARQRLLPAITRSAKGDAIVAWRDTRNTSTTSYDVYAQRIVSTGQPIPDKWYFAEGTTRPSFEQYLCLQNPTGVDAQIKVTYMLANSVTREQNLIVVAHSRETIVVHDFLGVGVDNSTKVECTNGVKIVAERPQYFSYGQEKGFSWPGGHDVVGSKVAMQTWYFAEGTTRDGFDEFVCMQNPNANKTTAILTYMLDNGDNYTEYYTLPPQSRVTVNVRDWVLTGYDVSIRAESTTEPR